jgi:hypothetical protein
MKIPAPTETVISPFEQQEDHLPRQLKYPYLLDKLGGAGFDPGLSSRPFLFFQHPDRAA